LVFLDLRICDTPLQESESMPARLAPKGINVKEAYQTFRTDFSVAGDQPGVLVAVN